MSEKPVPKAVIVFDVNVLIDAVNPDSRNHEAAMRAVSDDNGMPIYLSEMMLKTTTNKLLEMGANEKVVREYVEMIMSEDDYGPEKHVLGYIPVTDYGLLDKFGKSDYEDSTVVSLMDAAEEEARLPAVLISSDGALRTWCEEHERVAARPDQLSRLTSQRADDMQQATYQYLSRRMFRPGTQPVPLENTKMHAKQIVTSIRRDLQQQSRETTAAAEKNYRRFPELRPDEPNNLEAPAAHDGLGR
ncbi:hypothetical protein [Cryobacterium zhongshanensis]|uniref:PIN domain-containing protein n=1 Tax=Cryobacterium zhongshanensis TaxID=2928153 RepID=A0AA41R0C8_9MICO|nr:hypothetical protein [Cryobacterium zhongshanensis]MCI4659698.1 hypothetical protein [Cryobacterium zhongshanensis]